LTLAAFEARFLTFLLDEYHTRPQRELPLPPQARWEDAGFLPRLPESLEQLDLLLLTVAKTRRIRRDGIYFHGLRYLDPLLAAYVGEDVVIRYDPRDLAELRVYHQGQFLCRAVCQEVAAQTVSLKEIIRARNRRRRELKEAIKERVEVAQSYGSNEPQPLLPDPSLPPPPAVERPPARRLKLYENE
jgi:putative transposase